VISQLDHQYASEVKDILTSPPEHDPYTMLRTELVRWLYPLKEQCICELLTLKMGDCKPSQFLRHIRSLVPDMPDDFLCSIWSSLLPSNVQAILASQPKGDLNFLAHCTDRIIEAAPQPTLTSIASLPKSNTLLQHIKDLSRQVAALSAELAHLRSSSRDPRSSSRNHQSDSRSSSQDDATFTLCWYHRHYKAQAQKCTQPCSYCQQEKLTQRISTASPVCATTTGCLFIMDRLSKRHFLVDTGSDLSVYPHRLIPRCKECDNYDLRAAKGSNIPTYGWLPLSLNLGLRWNFMWRFVVTDVTHPLIGIDFLSHFGLLVDCKQNHLIGRHSRFLSVSHGAQTTSRGLFN
jgi:hypothetical protein